MNYTFDKLVEISEVPYFNIAVAKSSSGYLAFEVNTETVSHGPTPLEALDRLVTSLCINDGRDIIPEAEYAKD